MALIFADDLKRSHEPLHQNFHILSAPFVVSGSGPPRGAYSLRFLRLQQSVIQTVTLADDLENTPNVLHQVLHRSKLLSIHGRLSPPPGHMRDSVFRHRMDQQIARNTKRRTC